MEQEPMNEPGKISPWLLIVLGVVVLAAIGFFGWYFWNKNQSAPTPVDTFVPVARVTAPTPSASPSISSSVSPLTSPSVSPSTSSSPISTAGWKTYTNTKYGYSFKYPVETKVFSYGPEPGSRIDSTPTSSVANVQLINKEDMIFEIRDSGLSDTSKASINKNFGTDNININQVTIAGVNSYMVENLVGQKIYFFQKLSGELPVLEMSLPSTSSIAQAILSTFQFTK